MCRAYTSSRSAHGSVDGLRSIAHPHVAVASTRGEAAVNDGGEVDPARRLRVELQPALNAADNEIELAVVDAVDEDHTAVRTLCRRPLAQDAGEVADVVGDQDAFVFASERKHIIVVNPLQGRLLIEGSDVVSSSPQAVPDLGA